MKIINTLAKVAAMCTAATALSTGAATMEKNLFFCYKTEDQSPVEVDGLAYLSGDLWGGSEEGQNVMLDSLGIQTEYLYVLGGCNSHDKAYPDWGGGWAEKNFFIGNKLGEIALTYRDGTRDVVPLIVGYTAFFNHGYKIAAEPFISDWPSRVLLDNALCIANAVNGFEKEKTDYYFRIALRDQTLDKIELIDSAEKIGRVEINGLSFAGVADCASPEKFEKVPAAGMSEAQSAWVAAHTVSSAEPMPESRALAIKALQELLYTTPEQINSELIAKTVARVDPKDFPGPKVTFSGSPIAELMTKIYYDNTVDLMERVDDDGMVHESAKDSDYYRGFGSYHPDLGAFHDDAYTRLRGLTLLSNVGMDQNVNAAIDFFDKWMMYFPESYPDLQLGGKPVPGHATVVANRPHLYFDKLINVGWHTKYETRDMGNPETDGHGLLMISRWRAWLKQGRKATWVEDRWDAINEAAEFIPWQLDNPELSFSTNGLLYAESEGGMLAPSMYVDLVCYLGLLGYADMADVAGKPEKAARWRGQATRLFDAMMAYYPKETSAWGTVWDPKKNAMFMYTHSTLAPVCIGMDFWGYDVQNLLPEGWLEITQNTYKMQLARNKPAFAATAGIGYGQGYLTESALLLDKMGDGEKALDWMAKICFAPNLKYPYTVPEGSIIDYDGKMWRRWGDLGNLYQLGEVVYTCQLLVGIDDIDPAQLKIMPRIPASWSGMDVKEWPVRTMSGGESKTVKLSFKSERPDPSKLNYTIVFSDCVDRVRLRVGPFDSKFTRLEVAGQESVDLFESGDSKWAWIELDATQKTQSIKVKAQESE
ncbi:MAG: hypothetical protein ABFR33_06410 [Verrucomicrobiota bacterium]